MLIKGYDLSDDLIVEIGKFAVLWNLFESEYCDYNCNHRIIKRICSNITVSAEKQSVFANALNGRRLIYGQTYAEYIQNGLYSENRAPNSDEKVQREKFLNQESDSLCGCLDCVFRIRNIMMHGLKNVEMLNDQIEIFEAANGVLEAI